MERSRPAAVSTECRMIKLSQVLRQAEEGTTPVKQIFFFILSNEPITCRKREAALTRLGWGADFGNELVASLKVIISRDKEREAEGRTWRGRVKQSVFISHFHDIFTERARPLWGLLTCERGRWPLWGMSLTLIRQRCPAEDGRMSKITFLNYFSQCECSRRKKKKGHPLPLISNS